MAFLVKPFDPSDKDNRRVRAKLNSVVDAVNYLLRGGGGGGGPTVYGLVHGDPTAATILAGGDHITVTEDPTGTWTVDHNAVGDVDAAKDTGYLAGLSVSFSKSQTCGGVDITLTGAKNTLQFDEFSHKAGSVATTGDQVTFKVPETVDDLANVEAETPSDGDLMQYNETSGKWEKVSTTTQTVVTAWRVNGTDLEIKTRSIKVIAVGDEYDWTVAHGGTACQA